ncbi:MAG: hypothetical protein V8S34_00700, partial [Lawsonibacter sp.]
DLSYLTMTLSVDELDISNISVGQTVSITADAVEPDLHRHRHQGQRGGHLHRQRHHLSRHHPHRRDRRPPPGMSVDATIELQHADNVLVIPAAALNRGNTVLVTKDSPARPTPRLPSPATASPPAISPTAASPRPLTRPTATMSPSR